MKRALALVLAMILCLGLLASCGSNGNNGSNGVSICLRMAINTSTTILLPAC